MSVRPPSTSNTGYPPAEPGAALPAPTRTITDNYRSSPLPQPGALPVRSPTTTTAMKPTIPPPPKAGETLNHPGYYLPTQATSTNSVQPQPYPPQMALSSPITSDGQPPAAKTSTTCTPSYGPVTPPTSHPPGYAQNPYASDIAPSQRFVTNQGNQSGGSQPLNYNKERENSNDGYEDEDGVWGMAKKWAQGFGNYVTDINEKVSRNVK